MVAEITENNQSISEIAIEVVIEEIQDVGIRMAPLHGSPDCLRWRSFVCFRV